MDSGDKVSNFNTGDGGDVRGCEGVPLRTVAQI